MVDEYVSLENKLAELSKQELVDIIMEKVYADYEFAHIVENRFDSRTKNSEQMIRDYINGVDGEMLERHPSSYVIRSLTANLRRELQKWGIYDTCRAGIQIARTLDEALCNGAGMEDEEDFGISCDIEDTVEYIIGRIREQNFTKDEYVKVSELIRDYSMWKPSVMGRNIVDMVVEAL